MPLTRVGSLDLRARQCALCRRAPGRPASELLAVRGRST